MADTFIIIIIIIDGGRSWGASGARAKRCALASSVRWRPTMQSLPLSCT